MLNLNTQKVRTISIPVGVSWLFSQCMEAKGKQALWIRQKPAVLKALREQAMIQSAESSNRIEGITCGNGHQIELNLPRNILAIIGHERSITLWRRLIDHLAQTFYTLFDSDRRIRSSHIRLHPARMQ